ncbi:putative EF-hand domain-containing protein [Dioscorea sansibarensis]
MCFLHKVVRCFMKFHYSSIRNLVSSAKDKCRTSKVEEKEEVNECKACYKAYEGCISGEDAERVIEKLGIVRLEECEEFSVELLDGAYQLLEEKEASVRELSAAFAVFDEDGDGMVSEKDLWRVFQRLGFEELVRKEEECKKMINVYDDDGDGRISLQEFKCMLECST